MNKYIPQMEPWFEDEERKAMNDYLLKEGGLLNSKKPKILKMYYQNLLDVITVLLLTMVQ